MDRATETRYELRTCKTTAAIFPTQSHALEWLQKQEKRDPAYAKCLKLFKVTITTETEPA